MCPHAVQVASTTDAWGAMQGLPASNGLPVDEEADAAGKCRYVGKRHREEKLLLGSVHEPRRSKTVCDEPVGLMG